MGEDVKEGGCYGALQFARIMGKGQQKPGKCKEIVVKEKDVWYK